MKIGLVYQDCLGGGGYPRDVRWLASALSACGLEVTIFTREGLATEGLDSNVRIELLGKVGQKGVDIYHFFGIFLPQQLMFIRKVLDRAVVVSPMGHLMPYYLTRKSLRKTAYLQVIKPLLRQVRWFHSFAPPETESIRRYLGKDVRVFEGSLGVFPVPDGISKHSPPKETSGLNLLFFGRNDVYQKGIDVLLEGFAIARQEGGSATLTIAGRPFGESERYIRVFIEEYGLGGGVRYVGAVDEEEKYRLLAEADYLVFLSRWDGPPRPIREAIAVGTPVIVSPETNMGAMVDEYQAGLNVPLNPKSIAEAIARVSGSSELRERHREGAARLRERLKWKRVAQDYIEGYKQVLGKGGL